MRDWQQDGFRVRPFTEVDSTNDIARDLALAGEKEGLVVTAEMQRKGRGRHGRHWDSPPGNLYCSLLLRPSVPLAKAASLSLVLGLALADTISGIDRNLPVRLKWPNDVLIDNRKIAGILLESDTKTGSDLVDWLIAGLGLNLRHSPKDMPYPCTSLLECGVDVAAKDFLSGFLKIVDGHLHIWRQSGFAELRQDWLRYAFGIGSDVRIRGTGNPVSGRFLGIDADGTLQIRQADGQERKLHTGELLLAGQL